ncbi:MAG: C25 family cysteine peptidase [Bacteroidales bacterium]
MIFFSVKAQVISPLHTSGEKTRKISISIIEPKYTFFEDELFDNEFLKISGRDMYPGGSIGKPLLPAFKKLITAGTGKPEINIVLTNYEWIDLNSKWPGKEIIPRQPSIRKSGKPPARFRYDSTYYATDSLFVPELVTIEKAGISRGNTIWRLVINPFAYNPAKNMIRVLTSLEATLTFPEDEVETAKVASPYFQKFLEESTVSMKKSVPQTNYYSPPGYIILADTLFKKQLQPLVKWKKQKGFNVLEMYLGEDGIYPQRDSIRAILARIYNEATTDNPAPSFLLIAGDHEHVPSFYGKSGGHVTDLYYAEYDYGNDFMPELFYGRLSASTPGEMKNQVDKIIEYEQYTFPDPAFLTRSVLIAGADATYANTRGNGQIRYAAKYYFNDTIGISSSTFLHPEASYSDSAVIAAIDIGAGVINYTGHGEFDRWLDPRFNRQHADSIKNNYQYSLFIVNGCLTNAFNYNRCLGETLTRQKNKGAIGYIGGTNDSYWDEDYYWSVGPADMFYTDPEYHQTGLGAYDRMFHLNGEPREEWAVTQGQINYAGNMGVVESGSSLSRFYFEIYHLLGDPSLMIYHGIPSSLESEFPEALPPAASSMSVVTEPDALVALSIRDSLIASYYTGQSVVATLSFDPVNTNDTLSLVITKSNRVPVIRNIPVFPFDEAYLTSESFTIKEIEGTKNGLPEYGERILLGLNISNLGNIESGNVTIHLSTKDSLVTIMDSLAQVSLMPGNDTIMEDAFEVVLSENIPDQTEIVFNLAYENDTGILKSELLKLNVNAAVPRILSSVLDDTSFGNGNGIPERGEKVEVVTRIINKGHSTASDLLFGLSSSSDGVIPENDSLVSIDKIDTDDTIVIQQVLDILPRVEAGTGFMLDQVIVFLGKRDVMHKRYVVSALTDDFETGNFFKIPWEDGEGTPWSITASNNGDGLYTARSGNIGHYEKSNIAINLHVTDTGMISFQFKNSSEKYYDYFKFYIDDLMVFDTSGFVDWQQVMFRVSPGHRRFTWEYIKDGNTSSGLDAVWIDNIVFPPGVVEKTHDMEISGIVNNIPDTLCTDTLRLQLLLTNRGTLPLHDIPLGYSVNGKVFNSITITDTLLPGNRKILDYTLVLDSLKSEPTEITLFADYFSDINRLNDTIDISFYRDVPNLIPEAPLLNVMVYPLPANDHLAVTTNHEITKLELFDMQGKRVQAPFLSLTNKKIVVETSILPSGIYLLKVNSGNQVVYKKVLIQ